MKFEKIARDENRTGIHRNEICLPTPTGSAAQLYILHNVYIYALYSRYVMVRPTIREASDCLQKKDKQRLSVTINPSRMTGLNNKVLLLDCSTGIIIIAKTRK